MGRTCMVKSRFTHIKTAIYLVVFTERPKEPLYKQLKQTLNVVFFASAFPTIQPSKL